MSIFILFQNYSISQLYLSYTVFIKYENQMCIGQVLAVYFEAYSNYCFIYSLYIFIPIHLDLFSDIVQEGCNALTYHLASNIFYHILSSGVSIEGNIFKINRK